MKRSLVFLSLLAAMLFVLAAAAQSTPASTASQVTWQDYERASNLREKYAGLILHETSAPRFIGSSSEFWYRVTVDGGAQFILADAKTAAKKPAFDHAKIAAALST